MMKLTFNKTDMRLKIDAGSKVKIIARNKINQLSMKTRIAKTSVKLASYTGNNIQFNEQCFLGQTLTIFRSVAHA